MSGLAAFHSSFKMLFYASSMTLLTVTRFGVALITGTAAAAGTSFEQQNVNMFASETRTYTEEIMTTIFRCQPALILSFNLAIRDSNAPTYR